VVQTIKNLFGVRTNAQKAAAAEQSRAVKAQTRAANSAIEDAALARADANASGRRMRGLGRRALAFMGSELGVASSLSGDT
jgi:hypothetical protein